MSGLKLVFLVVFSIATLIEARVNIASLELNPHPDYVKTVFTKEERDGKPYMNFTTEVLQDIDGEIMVYGNVSIKHDGHWDPVSQIFPVDLCKFLAKEKKSFLLTVVWDEVAKYGDMPKSCPIKKSTFDIKDFTPDTTIIPPSFPGGDYHLEMIAELRRDGKVIAELEHIKVHFVIADLKTR